MTLRRVFIRAAAAVVLTAPFLATAQQAGKAHRVALILTTTPVAEMAGPEPLHALTGEFLRELQVLGYVEGRNLIFERRSAEGKNDRYPEIVAELIRIKTDVIAAAGSPVLVRQLMKGARTVPIVMIGGFPMETGLVTSLARPGGNVTGLTASPGPDIESKRLQLLKEVIPKLSRVAYLATKEGWDLPNARAARRAAPTLGVELLHAEHTAFDIDATLAGLARLGPDALFASASFETYAHRHQIVEFALKARLPGIYSYREMAETGGLVSYGVSIPGLARRAAHYVDKILRGARPADLPIEQPTQFELVINLKTARALDITIPPSILLRADRVIE